MEYALFVLNAAALSHPCLTSSPLQDNPGQDRCLGSQWLLLAIDLWPGLLRHRDDARLDAKVRPRSPGHYLPSLPSTIRRHDRRWHSHQQDGDGRPTLLRPDAGTPLGHQHGVMRQRRRILSLQLQRPQRRR